MSLNKYYQDELDYLDDLGDKIAQGNPDLERCLGAKGEDPDVNCLLRGFAFLTARLRAKLEDEYPELTYDLLSLLWPNYLRPVPATSILEFTPKPNAVTQSVLVDKGVEVASVRKQGSRCKFRTSYPVVLYPFSLHDVEVVVPADGPVLRLGFAVSPRVSFEKLGVKTLRLYLHGPAHLARNLYYWLCTRLDGITVEAESETGVKEFRLPKARVKPVGFGPDEDVLEYPNNASPGYRLLQEYFTLPEKFLFVDVTGLDKIAEIGRPEKFDLVFHFTKDSKKGSESLNEVELPRVSRENVRLYCTPIINLFEHSALPIRVDHKKVEYRVVPSADRLDHFEVYSIDKVAGSLTHSQKYNPLPSKEKSKRRIYRAFESFRHVAHGTEGKAKTGYYRTRLQVNTDSRESTKSGYGNQSVDTYISFITPVAVSEEFVEEEKVSLDLTCTNGRLVAELGIGDLCKATQHSPEIATFENIEPVTKPVLPPLERGGDWGLISNLSLNYRSLTNNIEALRRILSTYNFLAVYDDKEAKNRDELLEALVGIETESVDLLLEISPTLGMQPVRGLRTTITVRKSHFLNEGDLYLFGSVLKAFFAIFVHINSFHELVMKIDETNREYTWQAVNGERPIL